MVFLYIQILLCLSTLIYVYIYKKERDLLNPVYLFTIVHIYFFIMPPIFKVSLYYLPSNFDNNFAKVIGMVSYIAFLIGYFMPIKVKKFKFVPSITNEKINILSVFAMSAATLIITIVIFVYKVKRFGGIDFVLNNSFYVMNTLSKGKWFIVVLGSVFINSYYYFTAYCYSYIRSKAKWLLVAAYFVITIFVSGIQARSTIISLFLIFIFYENYKGKKLRLKHLAVVGIISIVGMFALNVLRQGLSFSKIFDLRAFISSFLVDTNPYENMAIVLSKNASERVFFKYLVLFPVSFIPRMLWPNKPSTLFEGYMMEKYIDFPANGTMTFTLPGTFYFNIGVVGIILGIALYARVLKSLYINFTQVRESLSYFGLTIYFLLLTMLLNGYRFSLEGILQNVTIVGMIFIPFIIFNKYINKSKLGMKWEAYSNKWITRLTNKY